MKKLFAYIIAMTLATTAMAYPKMSVYTSAGGTVCTMEVVGGTVGVTMNSTTTFRVDVGQLSPNDGVDIGNVGVEASSRRLEVANYSSSIWIDDTDAYEADDALGGLIIVGIDDAYDSFIVESARLFDLASQNAHVNLHCFDGAYTPTADDAAWDPTDSDMATRYLFSLHFTPSSYETANDNSAAHVHSLGIAVKLSGTEMYCQCALGSADTPTYTSAADVGVTLNIVAQ